MAGLESLIAIVSAIWVITTWRAHRRLLAIALLGTVLAPVIHWAFDSPLAVAIVLLASLIVVIADQLSRVRRSNRKVRELDAVRRQWESTVGNDATQLTARAD